MKCLVLTFAFTAIAFQQAFCQPNKTTSPQGNTGFILSKDTLLISLGPGGERYIHYRIKQGQTLYSFSRFLQMPLQKIIALNPGANEQTLEAGHWLRFPLLGKALQTERFTGFSQADYPSVYYPVRKGDNLYRVANVLLNVHPDTLKIRNGLISDQLQEGRLLHVGWFLAQHLNESEIDIPPAETGTDQASLAARFTNQGLGRKEIPQTGKAAWKKNQAANSGFSALHSFAAIGSIIAVFNPMNGREIFLKVIGRIPDTVYDKGTIVVLSPAAARYLGARDAFFFAKVKYHQ
jgi:LysM repeat protein